MICLTAISTAANTISTAPDLPSIDLSWSVTVAVIFASCFSSIAVAMINNHHARSMKKLELVHEEKQKQMELAISSSEKQLGIYYADKRTAFSDFLNAAGLFSMSKHSTKAYEQLHSSLDKALLFCNAETQQSLLNFIQYVDNDVFGVDGNKTVRQSYTSQLTKLAIQLNQELDSTKPVIDCKQSKH